MTDYQTSAEIEVGRVAQIAVHRGHQMRFGSGYLVAPQWVLTASHVVDGDRVEVRLGIGAQAATRHWIVGTWIGDPDNGDLALVQIAEPRLVPLVEYGRIGDYDNSVPCSMAGFPAFAFRRRLDPSGGADGYRDSKHVSGEIHPLGNRRERTLDITVLAAPPAATDPALSPWAGMSGAAVFSGGCLVAVVGRHHHGDGPGRLAATRITDWYRPAFAGDLAWIRQVTGLAAAEPDLMDVADLPRLACVKAIRTGITAARRGEYRQALDLLGSCQLTSGEPALHSDAKYYLALALLGGAAPRVRAWARIRQVERHLSAAVHARPDSPHAYALWAIVKEDYYQANGISPVAPPIAELWARAEAISPQRAAEIVRHVPAPDSPTWYLLCSRSLSHAENP